MIWACAALASQRQPTLAPKALSKAKPDKSPPLSLDEINKVLSSIATCTRRVALACTCARATASRAPHSATSATGWERVCYFGGTSSVPCT